MIECQINNNKKNSELSPKSIDDRADLITLDAGVLYKAGRESGVSPIMAEDYGQGDSTYWGIAVVKRDTTFTINDLKVRPV